MMNTSRYSLESRLLALLLSVLMLFQSTPAVAVAEDGNAVGESRGNAVYTVTFMDGETVVDQLLVNEGAGITDPPAAPDHEGGVFTAWLLNGSPVAFSEESPFTPTGDVTLTAQYANAYLVEFRDGDTVVASDYYQENTTVDGLLPADPEREGADFLGWFDDDVQITADTVVTGPITAQARFSSDLVVTFEVDGETYAEETYATPGSRLETLPEPPFKSGFRFAGWFNDEDEEVTEDTLVNESFTVTAKFEDVRVFQARVSFYYINYSGQEYEFDATIQQFEKKDLPVTIEVPPSTKVDEATQPDASKQIYYPEVSTVTISETDLDTAIAGAEEDTDLVTVYKKVKYVPYTVTYKIHYMLKDLDGDGYSLIEEVDGFGMKYSFINPPVKEYAYANFESADSQVVDTDGTVLEVRYARKGYTLTYDTEGGDYIAAVNAPYGTQITLPATATRQGYDFGGWYTDEACTQAAGATLTLEHNTTVYAKWTPAQVKYTIVYMIENANDDGYSFLASVEQRAATGTQLSLTGSQANEYAPTTGNNKLDKNNFTFKDSTTETIKADGSSVITVHYSRIVYTIRWNGDVYNTDGSRRAQNQGSGSITAKYGATITPQWVATFNNRYPDYAWSPTKKNNDKVISFDTMPGKGDSKWTLNGTTFTLYAFDFSTTKTQTLNYWLENYDSDTTTTRNGNTYGLYKSVTGKFNYLYDDSDFYQIVGYTKDGYTASYTEHVEEGHYEWRGWRQVWVVDREYDREANYTLGNGTPDANLTVNFYYATQSYPLTFNNYDGEQISTQQVKLNANISSYLQDNIPEAPVDGATWRGWFTDAEHTSPYAGNGKMPAGLVLYGDFTMPEYTFTFNPNGGLLNGGTDPVTVENIPYGSKQENNQTPTREGYVFTGWYNGAADSATPYDFTRPLTGDVTVYAHWSPIPLTYTVHYYMAGTTNQVTDDRTVDAQVYGIGDTVTEKAIAITGLKPDASSKTLTLTGNDDDNVIIFYYTQKPGELTYTVRYLIRDTEIPVAAPDERVVDGSTISVRAIAKPVDKDYMASHGATAAQLAMDYHPQPEVVDHMMTSGENIIYVWYDDYNTGTVVIRYLDMDGNEIKAAATKTGKVNATVNFDVTSLNGWSFKNSVVDGVSGSKKSLKLTAAGTHYVDVYFQRNLRIVGATKEKTFDNKYLKLSGVGDVTVTGLMPGHTLTGIAYSNASGRKNAGTTTMKPKNAVITGPNGTVNSYYKITYVAGSVTIHRRDVVVTIAGDQVNQTYDGRAHTAGYSVTSISDSLYKASYVRFTGTVGSVTRTDVGRSDLVLQGLFANGTTTAAKNFNPTFHVTDGYVNITPATLDVYSDSATKVYDGTPLTAAGCRVEGLQNGETLPVHTTSSRTDAGETWNDVAFDWDTATAKQGNYTMAWHNGKLTVTKADLTITAKPQTYTYDGQPHGTPGTYTEGFDTYVTVSGLGTGDSLTTLTLAGQQTDAGVYAGELVPSAVDVSYGHRPDSDIETLTLDTNYNVVYVNGTLTINKASMTVEAVDYEGVYDAEDHDGGATPSVTEGTTLQYSTDGGTTWSDTAPSITDVGEVTYTVKATNPNYEDATDEGTLTVTPASVTVTADDAGKPYDNDPTNPTTYTATVEGLFGDDTITYTVTRQAGEAVGEYPITAAGEAEQGNYTVTYVPGTFTITPIDVTVTIIGNTNTTPYDGQEHTVTGYTATASTSLYDVTKDFTFSGNAEAKRIDVGTTYMQLVKEQFANTNPNFKTVTFEVTDGYQVITPIDVTVTIIGNTNTAPYDGEEHTVTGYTATASTSLYDVTKDFTFSSTAEAKRTDVGSTYMELAADQFANTNPNFKTVTFEVTDGYQIITPIDVVVTIVGNTNTAPYDGQEHTVTGYTATADNTLYDVEKDFTFSGTAEAARTEVGSTYMELAADQFANTNPNFATVTFEVTDGYQVITPIDVTVTITGHNATVTYDGQNHQAEGYDVRIDNSLYTVDDFRFDGTALAQGVDAGSYPMGLKKDQFSNQNGNFATVTFVVSDGVLVIEKRTLTLTSASETREYNGQPLTNDTVTVTGDGFVTGEGAAYEVTGSQTLPGSSKNDFTYTLTAGTKAANYDIQTVPGTLTVTDRAAKYELNVTANSGETVYDGQAHTVSGFETLTFTVDGNAYTVEGLTAAVTGTDAGTYPNTVTGRAVVKDADGQDVTAQFTVSRIDGSLVIGKRSVTITTGSASKEYDGTALTEPTADITGLAEGDTVTLAATGTITEVGSTPNTYSLTWSGAKASNYQVTENLGTLTITANSGEITLTAGSGEKVYNGTALTNPAVTASGLPAGFTAKATAQGSCTDVGTAANQVAEGWIIRNARGEDRTASFTNVSLVDGTLTVTPAQVTITTGSASKAYDGTPLTKAEVSINGLAAGESVTLAATGTITEVGSTPNTYSLTWSGAKASNYQVSENLGTLAITENDVHIILTAASDSKVYDGLPLVNSGVTQTGLPAGFTLEAEAACEDVWSFVGFGLNKVVSYRFLDADGVDRTAWFTNVEKVEGSLEITPAPLTITTDSAIKIYDGTPLTASGYKVDGLKGEETVEIMTTGAQTEVGSSENSYEITWTGAIPFNYTVTERLGTLEVTESDVQVILVAVSEVKPYDGKALEVNRVDAIGLPEGFTWTATATGSQIDVGTSDNVVNDGYRFFDPDGNDRTGNFTSVAKRSGTLTVTPLEVKITTGSASKAYDGTPLTLDEAEITGLLAGESVTLKASGSITEVGSAANTYDITWDNAKARNYLISENLGTLSVVNNNSPVTLIAASDEKVYDGTPLTNDGVTAQGLPSGFTVDATAAGSRTDVGESANEVQDGWRILNADGQDRTACFTNVQKQAGTLTVTRRSLTLISADDTKAYDGTALTNGTVTVSGYGFAPGEGADYDVTGSQTLIGKSANTFTYSLKDGTSADNYLIETRFGTLEVTGGDPMEAEKTTEPVALPYKPGDTIPFEIRIHNITDTALTNLVVTDGTAEITAGEGYLVTGTHEAVIPTLAPDATVVVLAGHTVTGADILAGEYENTASIRMPDGQEREVTGTTDQLEDVRVQLSVTDEVTNAPDSGIFGLEETIGYRVTVTNDGNVDLYNVTVKDGTTGLEETIPVLAVGETVTFVPAGSGSAPSHLVTPEDILAGQVVSTVKAAADPVTDSKGETTVPQGEASVTTRVAQTCTLTINYITADGTVVAPQYTATLPYASAYDVASPEVEGYTTTQTAVAGILTEDTVVDVLYTANEYTLTILYRYMDGTAAAATVTRKVAFGARYDVASPVINGYRANRLRVTGTMPARDLTVTVLYAANNTPIVIDESETPLGLGAMSINVGETIE